MNGIGIAANILKPLETSSSIGMFARDTGGCLISKLALSRSSDETREISIAELSESAIFYFSAPMLSKGAANAFSKAAGIDKKFINTPAKELEAAAPKLLKKIKLAKFSRIASVFALILPAVFAIAPVRNFITLAKAGKEKFVNVVELDKTKHKAETKTAKDKAKKLFKFLGAVSAGAFALTAGITAFSKNKIFYKKAEPFIDKIIKHFDFNKAGDLELKHYGALIYPASIAGYFYASRDKYEKQENARRFAVTVPLLFYGEKLIQNPIYKAADKKFKTDIFNGGAPLGYKEILKMPEALKKSALKAKNTAYGLTFFINTMLIAFGIALLNRIETKRRYETEHKHQILPSFRQEEKAIWKDMKI